MNDVSRPNLTILQHLKSRLSSLKSDWDQYIVELDVIQANNLDSEIKIDWSNFQVIEAAWRDYRMIIVDELQSAIEIGNANSTSIDIIRTLKNLIGENDDAALAACGAAMVELEVLLEMVGQSAPIN